MNLRARVRGRGPRRPRRAFTLVEVAIAAVIFMILSGTVFQMFVKGSKASAKATWRSQVSGKTRNALRQLKEAINGSSYPSAVSLTSYEEDTSDAYAFTLHPSTASAAGDAMTTYTYSEVGDVLTFFGCYPNDQTPLAVPSGLPNGVAIRYRLHLAQSDLYSQRLELRMEVTTGTISDTLEVAMGTPEDRRIATEIESFGVAVPNQGTDGNWMLHIRITSRDPIDGFMRVIEETRANVNTALVVE